MPNFCMVFPVLNCQQWETLMCLFPLTDFRGILLDHWVGTFIGRRRRDVVTLWFYYVMSLQWLSARTWNYFDSIPYPMLKVRTDWVRYATYSLNCCLYFLCIFALTLLVSHQEEHPAYKNWVMSYSHGYLSGARCRWFAHGPADATATPSSLAAVKSGMVYLSSVGLPRLSWKKAVKRIW